MNKSIYVLNFVFLSVVMTSYTMDWFRSKQKSEDPDIVKLDNVVCEDGARDVPKTLVQCLENIRHATRGDTLLHTLVYKEKLQDRNESLFAEVGAADVTQYETIVHNSVEVGMQSLFRMGFDINLQNDYGETPLFLAVIYDARQSARLLLEQDAVDVNIADNNGKTPLAIACTKPNNAEIIRKLLIKASQETVANVFFNDCNAEAVNAVDLHRKDINIVNITEILKFFSQQHGGSKESSLVEAINNAGAEEVEP